MPPKNRFTREEILDAALELVRAQGIDALSARSLAEALGSSPKPIFGYFSGMEELRRAVLCAANECYQRFLHEKMAEGRFPPDKASGMAYILFAREERELFKLLFMRDRSREREEDKPNDGELEELLALVSKNVGISREEAFFFHMEQWVYVHGIASMIATSYLDWDMEFVSRALSDCYLGLKYRYTAGKTEENGNGSH